MDELYDNIGQKIKKLAVILFALTAFILLIVGIVILKSGQDSLLIGLLFMIGGPILAWIGSFLLYGFGQLIQSSDNAVAKLEAIQKAMTCQKTSPDINSSSSSVCE